MSQHGAALQTYNNELVKCVEELRDRRDQLQKDILTEEEERARLQNDIRLLSERLARLNDSLARKLSQRAEFDRVIAEAEGAYTKILESSQVLLNVLKKEAPSVPPLSKADIQGGKDSTAVTARQAGNKSRRE